MNLAAWTAALRIARREAWRGKLRSSLVIALVGLPVFVLAGADVLYRTYQVSPEQRLTRTIGQADARIQWLGQAGIQQTINPDDGGIGASGPLARTTTPPTTAEVAALMPRGSRLIVSKSFGTQVSFFTRAGIATSSVVGLDYADPIAKGIVHQVSGRAPRTDDEVALTTALADDTGVQVGDTIRAIDPTRTLHVVGLVVEPGDQRSRDLYQLPSAVATPPLPQGFDLDTPTWLVASSRPITWNLVTALNKLGYVTLSRAVLRDPPPKSAQTLVLGDDRSVSAHAIASATLVAGMVLLEIVLLAGPAFTVGARRRRHELGLLAAVGGGRRDLRRVVLADAIVLGVTAGVVGVLAGIGAAAAAEPLVEKVVDPLPGTFHVPWGELCALVLVSLGTALLAALMPAIHAARTDVVAALAGRRGTVRTSARIPALGAVIVVIGTLVSLGTFATSSAGTVLLGVALVEIGLIVASPALIGGVAHLARWLPVSGRIALRDAGRNRAAAAPAVAAVMATVIGAMAAVISAASSDAYQRQLYQPLLPQRDAYVTLGSHPEDATRAAAALRAALPGAHLTTVRSAAAACDPMGVTVTTTCTALALRLPDGDIGERWLATDLPRMVVDDGSGVDALFGTHLPAAAAALRAGRVVVLDGAGVHHGQVTVTATPTTIRPDGTPVEGTAHSTTAPATIVRTGFAGFEAIVPPAVASRLAITAEPVGVLATTGTTLTSRQRQAIAGGLARTSDRLTLHTEGGFSNPSGALPLILVGIAALVAVFAALIATALANIDSRADLMLLGAVGASPRTRRVLSLSRAMVITVIGTVIGALAGVLPARAWVRSIDAPVVIPWSTVGLTVIGIPLLAGGLAWLFTRARLPSERPA